MAVRGRAIKRRRSGDQDRFDEVSIAEPKEEFAGSVLRAENADGFQIAERKLLREPFAQRLRQIAHLVEPTHAPLVEPVHNLFRAVRALVLGGEIIGYLVEDKRMDRSFAGCLHRSGYSTRKVHQSFSELTQRAQRITKGMT